MMFFFLIITRAGIPTNPILFLIFFISKKNITKRVGIVGISGSCKTNGPYSEKIKSLETYTGWSAKIAPLRKINTIGINIGEGAYFYGPPCMIFNSLYNQNLKLDFICQLYIFFSKKKVSQ